MPGRSPHRRSPPPPPLISRHTPPRGRVRTPERHLVEMSSSRSRDRREFRPVVRRSRSPPPKGRSFSPPPLKRKPSPIREREPPRRTKISKSPVITRVGIEHYSGRERDIPVERSISGSERFRDRDYVEEKPSTERSMPQFRGPEGEVDLSNCDLKKFTIEIVRNKPVSSTSESHINRSIVNPDDIAPVRRPGFRGRGSPMHRGQFNNRNVAPPGWITPGNEQNEGRGPMFLRTEVVQASSSKDRSQPPDEYRRVVNIGTSRGPVVERDRSRERVRYSPGPAYEDSRKPYYHERERSPFDSRRRSPPRVEYSESREKREKRGGSREDTRIRVVDGRRREERRYSHERVSYERESDLRSRINEKRSDPHPQARSDEREHSSRRYETERDKHGHSSRERHHSPPPSSREKRRPASTDRHEESRSGRGEAWEREREGERRRRERPHSREREERGRDRERYEHSEHYSESDKSRRTQYKNDFEPPKKFYKTYEEKEFVPPPMRGRGGFPMRRGAPPMIRGRGIVRGMNRGFRGGMMVPRGVPRIPFMPMRGFPPRFFPPY